MLELPRDGHDPLERSTDTTDLPADGEDLPTRQAMELAEVAERCTRN
jgi:hypothetical protein